MVGQYLSIVFLIGKFVLRVANRNHAVPTEFPSVQCHLCFGSTINICIFQEHLQWQAHASETIQYKCYNTV